LEMLTYSLVVLVYIILGAGNRSFRRQAVFITDVLTDSFGPLHRRANRPRFAFAIIFNKSVA
jgi:hypothetical protein